MPESSETGAWEISGDKLAGAGLVGLRVDGNIPSGDAAGVAELDGTFADGATAVAGTSAAASGAGEVAGLPAEGDDAGGEIVGAFVGAGVSLDGEGDGTEEAALDDGEGAGDTVGGTLFVAGGCAGAVDAGGCKGEADGLDFGDGEGTGEDFVGDA